MAIATRRCNQALRVIIMTLAGAIGGYWARQLQEGAVCAASTGSAADLVEGLVGAGASFYAWSTDTHGERPCADGLLLAGPTPSSFNTVVYLVTLLWFFLGVMIGADVFMVAIERITSQETVVLRKVAGSHKEFTVLVWNATVANLTLMALGSSAPEILLSTIEICTSGFYAGELGPSTIVGSAAFNLLVISAVCVTALPKGEGRLVQERGVFAITAVFSVLAYLWLIVILNVFSPNIIELWEGAVTFLLFPFLVWLAYLADKGAFKCCGEGGELASDQHVVAVSKDGRNIGIDEAMALAGQPGNAEDAADKLSALLGKKKTRAFYRVSASRAASGGHVPTSSKSTSQVAIFQFREPLITLNPGQRWVDVFVDRSGNCEGAAAVAYRSVGSTMAGEARSEGLVDFAPGQTESYVRMSVLDLESAFYVVLVDPSPGAEVGACWNCAVLVEQAQSPGMLKFEHERMAIKESEGVLWVTIKRVGGTTGKIKFTLRTKDVTAFAGNDYVAVDTEVFMASGQHEHTFPIHVFDDEVYENEETFQIVLSEPQGGASFDPTTDGGADRAVATVTIISDEAVRRKVDEITALVQINADDLALSGEKWSTQFKEAFEYEGQPSCSGIVMYLLALPWKVAFAFTPPARIAGGWLCFWTSLAFIGVLTALIGDLATHMGCCMGLLPSITAITFVALGTSLPDTFASKTAAINEPHADAAIGNITGSNSVNVFLGLGLPWFLAACYWRYGYSAEAESQWRHRYSAEDWYRSDMPVGFVVIADDLGFSVSVFAVCACVCLGVLVLRRATLGYELGGNPFWAWVSAIGFVSLWFIYIGASVLYTYGYLD